MRSPNRVTQRGEPVKRLLQPELLDQLPPEDPRARGSRRDLERLNACMGHARLAAGVLAPILGKLDRPSLLELGGGDGKFFLSVASRLGSARPGSSALLLDLHDLLDRGTRHSLVQQGWNTEAARTDAFAWLRQAGRGSFHVVLANLFLHHFTDVALKELLLQAAARAEWFVALEPRRSAFALCFSRMVGLIGCNAVTRHDAPASVRAGFCGRELSVLWPADGEWALEERDAGLFSHTFVARRRQGLELRKAA